MNKLDLNDNYTEQNITINDIPKDYLLEIEMIDRICDRVAEEFKKSELRNYSTLEKICQKNNIILSDYLYNEGYHDYFEFKEDLKYLPRKELFIDDILSKIPKKIKEYKGYPKDLFKKEIEKNDSSCDLKYDLIYADNEVCYYDCHDGNYVFLDTEEALDFKDEYNDNSYIKNQMLFVNDLSENLLNVDNDKSMYNEISIKYNLYDCIKNNCYISDDFKKKIEGKQEIKDYRILSDCADYPILKENFSEEMLKKIEKVLEDFEYYQRMYDDGEIDIIGEYESKYGNDYLIDWYEGMMSTDSFIEIFKLEEKGGLNNEI